MPVIADPVPVPMNELVARTRHEGTAPGPRVMRLRNPRHISRSYAFLADEFAMRCAIGYDPVSRLFAPPPDILIRMHRDAGNSSVSLCGGGVCSR